MIKKTLLFVFLLVFSVSLACPIKPGFVANGLIRDTVRLIPMCGKLPPGLLQVPEGVTWHELYGFGTTPTQKLKLVTLNAAIRAQGFKQVNTSKTDKLEVYQYAKDDKTVSILIYPYKTALFLSISGN